MTFGGLAQQEKERIAWRAPEPVPDVGVGLLTRGPT